MRYLHPQRMDCLVCGKDFGTARTDVEERALDQQLREHWRAEHPVEDAERRRRILEAD